MYWIDVFDRTNTISGGRIANPLNATVREVGGQEHTLSFSVPVTHPTAADLVRGTVLRLQRDGAAGPEAAFRITWRSRAITDKDGRRIDVRAAALWASDFGRGIIREQLGARVNYNVKGELSPLRWLSDYIVPAAAGSASSSYVVGTVQPTTLVRMEVPKRTPLAGARMLEEALQKKGAGGELRFVLGADGRTYTVDLLTFVGRSYGATQELRYGANVLDFDRGEDDTVIRTRVRAFGKGLLTLADARWKVSATTSTTITLEGTPIPEANAFALLYFYVPGKGGRQITSSIVSPQRLTITGGNVAAVGDEGYFALDAAGTQALDYLELPSAVAAYGVIDPEIMEAGDIPDHRNLVANGDGSLSVNGMPANVTAIGGAVITEDFELAHFNHGGRAWKVVCPTARAGLQFDPITITADAARPYTGLLSQQYVWSGEVLLELESTATGTVYPINRRRVTVGAGYITLGDAADDQPLPAGTYVPRLLAHDAPATFTWDSLMATPMAGGKPDVFVLGQGAHVLWYRAVEWLRRASRPRVECRMRVVDRYAVDPVLYADEELLVGDVRAVEVPGYASDILRIVEIARDPFGAGVSDVVVSTDFWLRFPDPLRPEFGGERLPGGEDVSPQPQVHRVDVRATPRRVSPTVAALRVDITDPDRVAGDVEFFTTGPTGIRTGPLPATATGAGWAERSETLDGEHNLILDGRVLLRDGRSVSFGPTTFSRDGLARPVGTADVSYVGGTGLAQLRFNGDTVKVWVQESPAPGAWTAPVQATGAQAATFTETRSLTARRAFRAYGENASGQADSALSVLFYFDQWDGAAATVRVVPSILRPSTTTETLRLTITDPHGLVNLRRFFYTDHAGARSLPQTATRTPSAAVSEWDYPLHAEHNVKVEAEVTLTDGTVLRIGPITADTNAAAEPDGEPALSYDGRDFTARIPFDSDTATVLVEPEVSPGSNTWGMFTEKPGPVAVFTGQASTASTLRFRCTGKNAAGETNLSRHSYFTVDRYEDPTASRQPPQHLTRITGGYEAADPAETWTVDGRLGEGGMGPVQARVVDETGAQLAGWASVPYDVSVPKQPGRTWRFTVYLRDSTVPTAMEAAPSLYRVSMLSQPGQWGPGGAIVSVRDPGSGTEVGGGAIQAANVLVAALSPAPGQLAASVVRTSGTQAYPVGAIIGVATLLDNQMLVFDPPLARPVRLAWAGGGRLYNKDWAGFDQGMELSVANPSPSGGLVRAVLRKLGVTLTLRTMTASGSEATNTVGEAYNDRYTYNVSLFLPLQSGGSWVRVGFYVQLPGGVWTMVDEKTYTNASGPARNFTDAMAVLYDAMVTGAKWKVAVLGQSSVQCSATLNTITFQTAVTDPPVSMTPDGAPPLTVLLIAD